MAGFCWFCLFVCLTMPVYERCIFEKPNFESHNFSHPVKGGRRIMNKSGSLAFGKLLHSLSEAYYTNL